jgi:WD40 repeat protein
MTKLMRRGVFISYARSDGEAFADWLRTRLEKEHISLWQDRVGMEGGRDWWLQITEALKKVEFMVLIMTPNAMHSAIIRKEWRYARQQGVCVYPIKGVADSKLDYGSLPRWMRDLHIYDVGDLEERRSAPEWRKFVNDLNTRCQQPRVPFMVEDLPEHFVPRAEEFDRLRAWLLDEQREEPIAITAALRGAGGYGKTTLARALCHNEAIQEAFHDGILWVTLGESPGDLIGRVQDLILTLDETQPKFTGVDSAVARLVELLADRDILIVIDDVWDAAHLKPFMQGGPRCARLITTRIVDTLPANAKDAQVDAMRPDEAIQLLCQGLPPGNEKVLSKLAARLGEWPLLLTLANGQLRYRVNHAKQPLSDALTSVNKALDKHGLEAFDARKPGERSQAVARTLGVSFELLDKQRELLRFHDLAVFPEDASIPLGTLQGLWGKTGGLDEVDTEELCDRLYRLSLLLDFDLTRRQIRLHDVVWKYLVHEQSVNLAALNTYLLDAHRPSSGDWADLAQDEPYFWDNLGYHLSEAWRVEELLTTVKDLRYVAMKTFLRGASAVEGDLLAAETKAPDDAELRLLRRSFVQCAHIINPCSNLKDLMAALYSRLQHLNQLTPLTRRFAQVLSHPYLTVWHSLPDLPHPALVRTLSGHTSGVIGCAFSPDSRAIISASRDKTLKAWDAKIGVERFTLSGHADSVAGCAISADDSYIVSASWDKTLKVWDAKTGVERLTLSGHTGWVQGCAISADNSFIVSASWDKTLKVWDARTGVERLTLSGHTAWVQSCAISPDGSFIVSASWDKTLKVWDTKTGAEGLTLSGHTDSVDSCAISPDGSFIVSASWDKTLKVWDTKTGAEGLTLLGHTDSVDGCAISPDGSFIVSASRDKTLKVWDPKTGTEQLTLFGHTDWVQGCAISPDGSSIASASRDSTLKVWDMKTGAERLSLSGHTAWAEGCAISPDGSFVVSVSRDKTVKVWDSKTGTERLTLCGHTAWAEGCAISPDGSFIVSASGDNTLKVWGAKTGTERLTLSGHTDSVTGCAVSADSSFIVSASGDTTLIIWDARIGAELLTLSGHADWVTGCAISPYDGFIVSASRDKTLKVWDPKLGAARFTLFGHTDWVQGCAVSPDGSFIVSASGDKMLKVWNANTGTERLTLSGHTDSVDGCAISSDGSFIVSASRDKTLKVWDARTAECVATFYADSPLTACGCCPDNEHIVGAGNAGIYFVRLRRRNST